jgi:hypothetical protein
MTNTETQIAAALEQLVEIAGETTGARYRRVERIGSELRVLMLGHEAWSDEHRALAEAYKAVFRFRAFGAAE